MKDKGNGYHKLEVLVCEILSTIRKTSSSRPYTLLLAEGYNEIKILLPETEHLSLGLCVCVCVRERETDRQRQEGRKERKEEGGIETRA